MHSKTLFSTCLLGAAVAFPSGDWSTWDGNKPLLVDANFDDLTPALLDLEPVGKYDYLNYEGFSVGTEELLGVQIFGVKPHSRPNVAYSDVISSLFAGPSLQADYEGSKTKAFDLKSFYYACVDVSVTPVATAENCTITVTGYRKDEVVATQNFTYGQDDVLRLNLDATMSLAKLDKEFSFLTEVDFTYEAAEGIDTPPSFLGDDFVYAVYLKGEDGKGKDDGY